MECYPIRIGGKQTGTLEVSREGMYTVFRAKCGCAGELIRLSVFGEGKSGYLGVMVPDGNGNAGLTRRLSPSAMEAFPVQIEYAGLTETEMDCPCAPETGEPAPVERAEAAEPAESAESDREIPEEEETLWYSCPDGCLTTFDGKRNLIAMPAEDVRVPPGAEGTLRWICGKKYILFPE